VHVPIADRVEDVIVGVIVPLALRADGHDDDRRLDGIEDCCWVSVYPRSMVRKLEYIAA